MQQDKLHTINKIYPWFAGLTNNLVFYVVINTVWLTNVKGFDAMQVVFLEVCVGLAVRIFLTPALRLSERLGNTWAMRLGAIFLFITSLLLTFGTEYWVFMLAMLFQALAVVLMAMRDILIQDNLSHMHKSEDYLKISSRSHLIYTAATMIASLLVGIFFAKWQYLPMVLGSVICGIAVVMSFFIYDIEDSKAISNPSNATRSIKNTIDPNSIISTSQEGNHDKLSLPHPIKLSLTVLIFSGLLYGVINLAQNNGKLLLQYQLETQFSVDQVVAYLGLAWFISQVVRIIVDLIYPALQRRLQNKVVILLALWGILSVALLLLGFFLPIDFASRMLLMASGFILSPAIRDPLHIFCQTTLFKKVDKADRKDALVYLVVMQQAGQFLFSLVASAILLFLPLQYTIVAVAIAAIPVFAIALRLSRILRRGVER